MTKPQASHPISLHPTPLHPSLRPASATVVSPCRDDGPHLGHEGALWGQGFRRIAGIDEAGRGALAGPVAAAAVVLPCDCAADGVWAEVRDSKLLRPAVRTRLDGEIRAAAAALGVGMASAQEIDTLGIAPATRLAMMRAIEDLAGGADYLLIDWVRLAQCAIPQSSFAKADRISVSVAAASIVAKVARDTFMTEADRVYPAYGFARHKGYGARAHLAALNTVGPCTLHRHTFAPIARRASLFDTAQTEPGAAVAMAKRSQNAENDG